jgi:alpha-glucosidase
LAENKQDKNWWKGGVIYQIYPRSFKSSRNKAAGDLNGITEKLDYVASLGVDGFWLSPFFKSPMADYGYDVSDYKQVAPQFGNLKDFDRLLEKADRLDLKAVIDMIMPHTSDQHAWFKESRKDRANPKADWYIWTDPKPDGSPPNNWQSVFGGASWTFDAGRGQYYMHNFLKEQPQLNLRNPEARKAILDASEFWLKRGVSGLRLDSARCMTVDPALRDNPPRPDGTYPLTMQLHVRDNFEPLNLEFIENGIRPLLDRYGAMAVAETCGDDEIAVAARYTDGPKRLHTAYTFGFFNNEGSGKYIRHIIEAFNKQAGAAWPSWAFSNHDVTRAASRWHPDKGAFNHDPRLSKMLNAMLLSLRGTIFMYQGEELGLPETKLTRAQLRDPVGKTNWPHAQGRDGCRTPMPWQKDAPHAGFSTNRPWLPISDEHRAMAVDVQEQDAASTLNFTRACIAWRKANPALRTGSMEFIDMSSDDLLGFTRKASPEDGGQTIVCLFNFSARETTIPLPEVLRGKTANLFDAGERGGTMDGNVVKLPAYGVLSAKIA